MDRSVRSQIAAEFLSSVERTIDRIGAAESQRAPFHEALLPPIGRAWSRFERSFSTSLGQGTIERLSRLAAIAGGAADVELQRETACHIDTKVAEAVENHIESLRANTLRRDPDWTADLAAALSAPRSGRTKEIRVISDLWFMRGGVDHFVSIKTVKPNIDQTAEAKRNMLHLALAYPGCNVFFALYYNPFGERREDYNWGIPSKVFSMKTDPVVLIDHEYWDFLGGPGTMSTIVEIAREVGITTQRLVGEWSRNLLT
jgi:hypothetical protein